MTLRFCSSDAIGLCFTLRNLNVTGAICANSPCGSHQTEYLSLDSPDYKDSKIAPRSFDIIDTSNLVDHLGALTVLPAATPLLERNACSTLYTELLAKRSSNFDAILDDLLGGHFPTMTVLIGLFPVGYWTNVSAVSDADEQLLGRIDDELWAGQIFHRQDWKLQLAVEQAGRSIQGGNDDKFLFDDGDLIEVLLQCYRNMFRHEDLSSSFAQIMGGDLSAIRERLSLPRYHRGNFVALLKYVLSRVVVPDWRGMMRRLVEGIVSQSQLTIGANHLQDLCVNMHMHGLYSVDMFPPAAPHVNRSLQYDDFRAWRDTPGVLSVTVRIPRAKLDVFTKHESKVTPLVNGFLESKLAGWQNVFGGVQLCFGSVTTVNSPQ